MVYWPETNKTKIKAQAMEPASPSFFTIQYDTARKMARAIVHGAIRKMYKPDITISTGNKPFNLLYSHLGAVVELFWRNFLLRIDVNTQWYAHQSTGMHTYRNKKTAFIFQRRPDLGSSLNEWMSHTVIQNPSTGTTNGNPVWCGSPCSRLSEHDVQ